MILFGGVVIIRGNLRIGLRSTAPPGDRFDPGKVCPDHLRFGVASHDDLEQAVLFDARGVNHGEITRLPSFGSTVRLRGFRPCLARPGPVSRPSQIGRAHV